MRKLHQKYRNLRRYQMSLFLQWELIKIARIFAIKFNGRQATISKALNPRHATLPMPLEYIFIKFKGEADLLFKLRYGMAVYIRAEAFLSHETDTQ